MKLERKREDKEVGKTTKEEKGQIKLKKAVKQRSREREKECNAFVCLLKLYSREGVSERLRMWFFYRQEDDNDCFLLLLLPPSSLPL